MVCTALDACPPPVWCTIPIGVSRDHRWPTPFLARYRWLAAGGHGRRPGQSRLRRVRRRPAYDATRRNLALSVAVWLGRSLWSHAGVPRPTGRVEATPAPDGSGATRLPRVFYLILAVSGATAMVYEMAWSRTLSMVYGSSVYGVSITLATFLVGIALGSWIAAARVRRRPATTLGAVWLLAGSAWAAFVSLYVSGRLPFLFLDLYRWVAVGPLGSTACSSCWRRS